MKIEKIMLIVLFGMQCMNNTQDEKIFYWPEEAEDIYQKGALVAYHYKGTNDYDAFEFTGGIGKKMLPNGKELFDQLKREFLIQYEPSEDVYRERDPKEFSNININSPEFSFEKEPNENENN